MSVLTREYNEIDEKQLENLLFLCGDNKKIFSIVRSKTYKFAYVAFIQDELVGICVGWENTFHPSCIYFRIVSHPFYEKAGVNEALLYKIERLESVNKPLQTSIWDHVEKSNNIYERARFEVIRKTYLPTLSISSIEFNKYATIDDDFALQTLEEVMVDDAMIKQLTMLVRSNYEASHRVNPVVTAPLDEWKKRIFADDTIVEGSYLYVDQMKKEIVAYSFLHESDEVHMYELGWCGCSNNALKKWLPQLVQKQLKYAQQKGIQIMSGEFDTTDDYAMEVFKAFPFSFDSTWITYRK